MALGDCTAHRGLELVLELVDMECAKMKAEEDERRGTRGEKGMARKWQSEPRLPVVGACAFTARI